MVDKLAALHESWDAARYDYKPNIGQMYQRWLTVRASDPQGVLLVAERERDGASMLVGFLVGTIETPIPIYRIEKFGYIHDLWVDEPYRHEGVARQMTMLAIEKFRDMGDTSATGNRDGERCGPRFLHKLRPTSTMEM